MRHDIIKLRARKEDGTEPGDDLAGIIECARRYLGDVKVTTWNSDDHRLGTVQGGGIAVDIYGDDAALKAAQRLRRETIKALAAAVDLADTTLGLTHPLARYLEILREGCGPDAYHSRPAAEYTRAAMTGCDLRFDQ